MDPSLQRVASLPGPSPDRPWQFRQSWRDLLFAHWPVPAAALRPLVPRSLEIAEREGSAWLAIVPFLVRGVARRPLPELPWTFPELHLRLCVTHEGRPGAFLLSCDAGSRLAAWLARRFFHLPSMHAWMRVDIAPDGVRYRSVRAHVAEPVVFEAVYRATSPPRCAEADTLEHWLTERDCLYTPSPDGALQRTELQHAPWPLQRAEVAIHENDLLRPHGISVPGDPVLAHFVRRQDVRLRSAEEV